MLLVTSSDKKLQDHPPQKKQTIKITVIEFSAVFELVGSRPTLYIF